MTSVFHAPGCCCGNRGRRALEFTVAAARKLIDKVHFSSNGGFSQNVEDGPVPYKIFGKHVTNNQIIYFLLYNSGEI